MPVVGGEVAFDHDDGEDTFACHVSFDEQRAWVDAGHLFEQARWSTWLDEQLPTVSDALSARSVFEINPFEVDGDRKVPAWFTTWRAAIIRQLSLKPLLGRTLAQCSNGERRRALLARACLRRPRLLLLDHPLTGLDVTIRERIGRWIKDLPRHGIHPLIVVSREEDVPAWVTHVLEVARCAVRFHGTCGDWRRRRPPSPVKPLGLAKRSGRAAAATQPDVLIDIQDATVRYGQSWALRSVTWTVRRGEHWAVVGSNGAGKTTLLGLVTGDHPQAYANRVRVFGVSHEHGGHEEIRRRIGWLSPELQLYFDGQALSAGEAVITGIHGTLGLYRRPAEPERLAAIRRLRQVGWNRSADMPYADLSEGEQRLVLLARALANDPWLLMLDEPFQGVDGVHRDRLLHLLEQIGRAGSTTIVLVTHNRREIPACVHRVLRLRSGRVFREEKR
jgi:molybdate transport system ATP-binding protein